MERITILIADDHKLIREAWAMVLDNNPSFQVIATTGSAEEGIEQAKKYHPDIVIMDINLPGISGIDAIPLVKKYSPTSKIIGVSLHTQPAYAKKMLRKGAMGYVTKNSSSDELFKAIHEVLAGRQYVCEEIKNILSEQLLSNNEPNKFNRLSEREMEVIEFIRKGLSSKEIGSRLGISGKTVEVHRYNILKKLELKNTAALLHYINTNYFGLE
jgi:DNA-binding NarL/FixJ family response regulator